MVLDSHKKWLEAFVVEEQPDEVNEGVLSECWLAGWVAGVAGRGYLYRDRSDLCISSALRCYVQWSNRLSYTANFPFLA
jgi:hypothetical protein